MNKNFMNNCCMDYKNKDGLVEMSFLWNISSYYKDDAECLDATVHKEFIGEDGESWQDLLSLSLIHI